MASEIYEFAEGFQLKILASMARDRSFFITYQEILQPKYFRKDIHIDLAKVIHDYYELEMSRSKKKGTDVNTPSLEVLFEEVRKLSKNPKKAQIKDQYQDAVVDIVEMDLSDLEYIKDSVVSFGRQAAMQHAILESVDILESGNEADFSKIEEKVRHALSVGEDIGDLGIDYFAEAEQRTQEYQSGTDGTRRVPTGLEGVDKVMKGGLGDAELGVIIAPPNRGKSIALTNIGAGAVLTGHNVFHYTLEMPERQVAKRYDLRMTNKNFDYLRENAGKVLTAIHNIQKIHKGHLIIKKYRTNEATVNTIRSHITRTLMEKGIKPDVIIVDYADLLMPTRSYSDKRYELESIYLALRDLGDEFNCPVWTASQANRGALDKKVITIADLAEAFLKANIADFMVALCQSIEEKDSGEMRFHVCKHRDGEANMTLEGDIIYETSKISVFIT